MKKALILLVLLCFIFTLTACKQPPVPSDTQSDEISNSTDENNTASNNHETNDTSSNNDETNDNSSDKDDDTNASPDTTDERITTVGDKKVFKEAGITLSVPADWTYVVEDYYGTDKYFFSEPSLLQECQLELNIRERLYFAYKTEAQYLDGLINKTGNDTKIESFTFEEVCGYKGRKIVYSYTLENAEFVGIDYYNVVAGDMLYNFYFTYPAAESEKYESTIHSIINAVELTKIKIPPKDQSNSPYPIKEISEEKITVEGDKKVFREMGINLSVPADWTALVRAGVDGSNYFFSDPNLGENCEFGLRITGSEYFNKYLTEEEYAVWCINATDCWDAKLISFSKGEFKGRVCTKAVYSDPSGDIELIETNYDNIIDGGRLYDFFITYPAAESEKYEGIFESILDSIEFKTITY